MFCITPLFVGKIEGKMYSGKIIGIQAESLAEELGLEIGDKILTVNGQELRDIIDLSFAFAEEEINLLIERKSGEQEMLEFDKEYDEELGAEFESAVFDGIRRCGNRCCFCFVDQIAPGMRTSLSVKDDDYRMSFLYGNFVTLTNMVESDFSRIKQFHLTPLFVSVQTTNGELRAQMLNNKRAKDILQQLDHLAKSNVEYHTQVVLCPGLNDGNELDRTIQDIIARQPYAQSLAIVPVGLTKYREGCYPLKMFDAAGAGRVIDQVEKWQSVQREKTGRSFIYLGDEFYFIAGRELPPTESYDGFPQLDNGIGLIRNFIDEWQAEPVSCKSYREPLYLDIICGISIAPVLTSLVETLSVENLYIRVLSLENTFFGKNVTVSGLLTGQDILKKLKTEAGKSTGVILPESALRAGEEIFLDEYSLEDLQKELKISVKTARGGADLKQLLLGWKDIPEAEHVKTAYMWQSNAAYTKPNRKKSDRNE
jgi:putative radical SAM enzyme (TIGR03279 family)